MEFEIDGVKTGRGCRVSFLFIKGNDCPEILQVEGILKRFFTTVGQEEFVEVQVSGYIQNCVFCVDKIVRNSFDSRKAAA